jgi:hypothetical protein
MNSDEELELLLEVLREQPLPTNLNQQNILRLDDKTLKELTNMVSVNFSVEKKLDRIIELLEKLVPQPVVLNTPITVKSEDDNNVGIDINKSLYELVNKVEKRQKSVGVGQEEFIKRLNEIDWDKLVNSFGVEKLPDNSLAQQVKSNLLPKVVTYEKFTAKANKINWNSLKVEKPTIRLLDDKGNVINFECQIKEDGSITCVNRDSVVVDW